MNINGHNFDESPFTQESVVIDVGALYGVFSKPILERFNCYVDAYEPSKDNYLSLLNIKHPRFRAVNKAVSSFTGSAYLNVFGYGWDGGSNTLSRSQVCDSQRKESYQVEVINIKEVLRPYKTVELMKLDCEGSEKEILLRGDMSSLLKCKQIVVEFHAFRDYLDISAEDIEAIIQRLYPFYMPKLEGCHPDCLFTRREK
jgi:FkbM family methyltransferase